MVNNEIPYYKKFADRLFIFLMLAILIYLTRALLIPIVFAILFSITLLPLSRFLERRKIYRGIASLIAVIAGIIILGSVIFFLSFQAAGFLRDVPTLQKNLNEHFLVLQNWMDGRLHISTERQGIIIDHAALAVKNSGSLYLGKTFLTLAQAFLQIVVVAVETFFILYYRNIIKRFLLSVFEKNQSFRVENVLEQSKLIIQQYINGLLIEMALVASTTSIVLLLIGIKYAIFFGLLTAFLNLVPYVGIFCSIIFTVVINFATASSLSDIIWIIAGMFLIHLADANFILPKVVGSKVKVNALISFTGIAAGAIYVGLAGIFLAIPVLAIMKIIFDNAGGLESWAILLGEENPNKPPKPQPPLTN